MATKKVVKKVVKFPDTVYVTKAVLYEDVELCMAESAIENCVADTPVLVGVYQLVGVKNVTKKVEIVTEDVNG